MIKRLTDIIFSLSGLIILFPVFLVIALLVKFNSKGPVFYLQQRIGKKGIPFRIFKFRTMYLGSDRQGLLTVGGRDPRVTSSGYILRRYKLDELPQILNVLIGNMSLVGPRPEVEKYVRLYNEEQRKVLSVKPGITDYASIEYANENELLATAVDPEKVYIEEVMPAKLALNLKYIKEQSFYTDMTIILSTIARILS